MRWLLVGFLVCIAGVATSGAANAQSGNGVIALSAGKSVSGVPPMQMASYWAQTNGNITYSAGYIGYTYTWTIYQVKATGNIVVASDSVTGTTLNQAAGTVTFDSGRKNWMVPNPTNAYQAKLVYSFTRPDGTKDGGEMETAIIYQNQ